MGTAAVAAAPTKDECGHYGYKNGENEERGRCSKLVKLYTCIMHVQQVTGNMYQRPPIIILTSGTNQVPATNNHDPLHHDHHDHHQLTSSSCRILLLVVVVRVVV